MEGFSTFAGDLIYLVNVDDAALRRLDRLLQAAVGVLAFRRLQQFEQNVFHILAHIPGFRQAGGVGDGEGNLQNFGQCLRQQGFARTGRPDQQNIAFLQFDVGTRMADALVVVVNGDGQAALGALLPDHVLAENAVNLFGLGHRAPGNGACLSASYPSCE